MLRKTRSNSATYCDTAKKASQHGRKGGYAATQNMTQKASPQDFVDKGVGTGQKHNGQYPLAARTDVDLANLSLGFACGCRSGVLSLKEVAVASEPVNDFETLPIAIY